MNGRQRELATLLSVLEPDGPVVVHVHGVPGIGKSELLATFLGEVSGRGVTAGLLDCRLVEPTEQGFRTAVAALGVMVPGEAGVLGLDNYDSFQLLDSWLRTVFVPESGGGLRIVSAGSRRPGPAWLAAGDRFLSLRLNSLEPDAAREILAGAGLGEADADRINRFAKGHPLALKLAIAAARDHSEAALEELALPEVVTELTRYFLAEVEDEVLREALEAASAVRRVTEPVLGGMLPGQDAAVLYRRLAGMSFVESRRDGLGLHPAVHEAIAQHLRSADPSRFVSYRRGAWRALERDSARIAVADLWRYTADVIYLIENPTVREAFFPSGAQDFAVEVARPEDVDAILGIAACHDGAAGRAVMASWWGALPQAFHVVRDRAGEVVGFYLLFDPVEAPADALAADPIARAWTRDLRDDLGGQPRRVLFLRRWLARDGGEAPSAVQAACWLDVKRAYLEFRPQLVQVYLAVTDLGPYASAAQQLGFEVVCADPALPQASARLDFGPGSVDAWLGRLVARELAVRDAVAVDDGTRELLVGPERIGLTQLECGVMAVLLGAGGRPVGRDRLLEEVWGEKRHAVGSNVVDVVVRALRRKLGPGAAMIKTVRGAGYRVDA